ncbi:hypothetical protein RHMOL_Rhmol12G0129500 [Rhododendron molle]|uniref:Uncharacterized protein n=1 Tax=Rhododendron molle TaxID=49168 RepID=A0ACC0LHC8_RHOML|nr:hypothetical protein RHMOL_Rhmol12G0129500 [Rhododendron molle]
MPLFRVYVAGVGEKKQTGSGQSKVEVAAFLERNASRKNHPLLRRFTPGSVVRARRFNCRVEIATCFLCSITLRALATISAQVLLNGGQVVSWKNDRGEELLFMSSKANWKSSKAIRGGISVCLPQFGNLGSLFHRSPRNKLWSIDSCPSPRDATTNRSSVDLLFKPTEEDTKMWQRSFELRLHISLGPGKLTLVPRLRNTDNKSFAFTFSICNYLSVSDISEVRVEGLETLDYFDNLLKRKRLTEQADAVTFDGEVDRVYLHTPANIAVIDHEKKRTFVLHKEGLADAVVWNPWEKMAKAIPELGDHDYKNMLYVCSAAFENPIVLKPMEEWKGGQELSTVSSSYCSGQLDPQKVLLYAKLAHPQQ